MLTKPRGTYSKDLKILLAFLNLAMYTKYVTSMTRNGEGTWYEVSVSASLPRYFRIMSFIVSDYIPSMLEQGKIC